MDEKGEKKRDTSHLHIRFERLEGADDNAQRAVLEYRDGDKLHQTGLATIRRSTAATELGEVQCWALEADRAFGWIAPRDKAVKRRTASELKTLVSHRVYARLVMREADALAEEPLS